MDETVKCFVCHMKTDDWRNELDGLKSQHSSTNITDFIRKILGDFETKRNIDDQSNCICVDCLNRFEEYDWTCTMAKQYEKELYDLLVHTESLCFMEKRNDMPVGDTEPSIGRPYLDPLTGFVETSFQTDDIDGIGDDDLLNVMAEPLIVPKDKQSDEGDLALDCGAIENAYDDPDFNCKIEFDSSHGGSGDNDDVEYLPPKRIVKAKKTKLNAIKVEDSNVPALSSAPKKRGRKPKIRDGTEDDKKKREKKTYQCKNCEKVFDKCVKLLAHEKWHREQKIPEFRCPNCFYILENQEAFDAHEKLHENVPLLQCVFCNKIFASKGGLTKHTHTYKKQCAELQSDVSKYRCDICYVDPKNEGDLAEHKKMHIGLSPLQCVVCKKTFKIKRFLRQHMRLHTGEKKYQCHRCGNKYFHRQSFIVHMAYHDGIRSESCPHCPRQFITKADLEKHKRIHTGEKPYLCGICGKRFVRRDNMREHQKIHDKQETKKIEKTYSCTNCNASFARSSKLLKHMENHGVMSFTRDIRIENELNKNDNKR